MNRNAFTLIETLVVFFIFSILLASAMFSFKYLTSNISNYELTIPKEALFYAILKKSINGLYYYPIEQKTDSFNKEELSYFFRSSNEELSFITSTPFFMSDFAVVKLSFNNTEIIYEESPLFSSEQNFKVPVITENKKVYKLKNIKTFTVTPSFVQKNIPSMLTIAFTSKESEKTFIFNISSQFYNHIEFINLKTNLL